MTQTKKRLKIINLALSITDLETIDLQIAKLRPLKSDIKIQEIIEVLQEKTYAQAQALIQTYIETPNEEILQRTAMVEKELKAQEDSSIIEEFNLFVTPKKEIKNEEELFDMERLEIEERQKRQSKETPTIDLESFLEMHVESSKEKEVSQKEASDLDKFLEGFAPKPLASKNITPPTHPSNTPQTPPQTEKRKTPSSPQESTKETTTSPTSDYPAISYIEQKVKNLMKQYPTPLLQDLSSPSAKAWIDKIATQGYSEKEIHEIQEHIEKLIANEKKEEATQLLFINGATLSKFAQFMFARALYRGSLLEQNIEEAFKRMHTLALNENYPEALCDLGQFYEHGIGTEKDLKQAENLYAEAMNLGVNRATKHYERLKKSNSGLFSFLKK